MYVQDKWYQDASEIKLLRAFAEIIKIKFECFNFVV